MYYNFTNTTKQRCLYNEIKSNIEEDKTLMQFNFVDRLKVIFFCGLINEKLQKAKESGKSFITVSANEWSKAYTFFPFIIKCYELEGYYIYLTFGSNYRMYICFDNFDKIPFTNKVIYYTGMKDLDEISNEIPKKKSHSWMDDIFDAYDEIMQSINTLVSSTEIFHNGNKFERR